MRPSSFLVLTALFGLLAPLPLALERAEAQGLTDRADTLPVSALKPGMKGYGLTVFQGTKPERFEVEIIEKPSASYYQDYIDGNSGNIVDFGWGGWTLDFDNTYYSMMYTGETYNPSYSNPEADALLDEQRGTLDQDKRLDIAHQLNAIFFEDALDVALYQNIYLWGVNDRVKNFSIPPDERLFWLDAWIEG